MTCANNDQLTDETDLHNLTKLDKVEIESDRLEMASKGEAEKRENPDFGVDAGRKRELDDAVEFGLRAMQELVEVKEPHWYQMGLYLRQGEPARFAAEFGAPGRRAEQLSRVGFAATQAAKRIAESYPDNVSRQSSGFSETRLLQDECPLRGAPRCPAASRRYRTADGTCNNFNQRWRGAALLPVQRFLPPAYDDGIQEVRRSVSGKELPSAREVSIRVHRDKNLELPTVTLMFMQWGQLIDHDLVSTVKSRSFNGSVPRCCHRGGLGFLPPELMHPSCLPIEVPPDDWFLSPLGIRCIEFIRSAPSTRIDCDLGYREQINQATSFLDASTIYGSDVETSDSMRTLRNGKLHYGRPQGREPLQPPDPPGGELCRGGGLTSDCLQGGDGRLSEQPGLTALHTVWVRYHNKIAGILSQLNRHWSDEKVYQETRRIVIGLFQHITYREFLPIVLGQEVMDLFGLTLDRKGYYSGFDKRVNPSIANSFGAAAFRFGHSLVQNSFIRFDGRHRPLFNNVTLHEEQENVENIWSMGSLDRLLIGFCNQPSQRRDEFVCDELTNHLFQSRGFPFGMDLTAINIQRGRDHGLPSYTSWRKPCGLTPIKNWQDLEKIMNLDTVDRFRSMYEHVDDIDLFSGGLAEKPVRGGLVGPTFACIIAQQFLNLRKGDRFWYENGNFESSFTPAQLQQIRHGTFAHVLCQTLTEIETLQPFVFLMADGFRNARISCDSQIMNNLDLSPWIEEESNEIDHQFDETERVSRGRKKKRKVKRTTTRKPPVKEKVTKPTTQVNGAATRIKVATQQNYNTNSYVPVAIPQRPTFDSYTPQRPNFDTYNDKRTTIRDDMTYLFGVVGQTTPIPPPTPKPFEVNIKIQYYPPTTPRPATTKKRRPRPPPLDPYDSTRPYDLTTRPTNSYSDDFSVYRPTYVVRPPVDDDYYGNRYEDRPFSSSKRPYVYRPNSNGYVYSTQTPQGYNHFNRHPLDRDDNYDNYDKLYGDVYSSNGGGYSYGQNQDQDVPRPFKYATGHVEKISSDEVHDRFNLVTTQKQTGTKFVKISSVRGEEYLDPSGATVQLNVAQREGDLELDDGTTEDVRFVDIDVVPGETKWLIYNATEEVMELVEIPDVNVNVSCTNELPRPLANLTMVRQNLTVT